MKVLELFWENDLIATRIDDYCGLYIPNSMQVAPLCQRALEPSCSSTGNK